MLCEEFLVNSDEYPSQLETAVLTVGQQSNKKGNNRDGKNLFIQKECLVFEGDQSLRGVNQLGRQRRKQSIEMISCEDSLNKRNNLSKSISYLFIEMNGEEKSKRRRWMFFMKEAFVDLCLLVHVNKNNPY